jgi:DNA mismatch endonuclease (patch repair protein)
MPTWRRSTEGRLTPSFSSLSAASASASRKASRASTKKGTRCELQLRSELRRLKVRFRTNATTLPGCPDFVFDDARLIVFADGDFWHGRALESRLARLNQGHNADYWLKKLLSNVARDRRVNRVLRDAGWSVMRVWEGDIKKDARGIAERVVRKIKRRSCPGGKLTSSER